MPSLLVCALLALALAVLVDVLRAPDPALVGARRRVETPVVIVGLERLREMARFGGSGEGMLQLAELGDAYGEVELPAPRGERASVVTRLPSIIVED